MKKELLLTVSAATLAFIMAGPAIAAQPPNIEIIRCSNNGNGNGDEVVTFGQSPSGCEKFNFDDGDNDPPGNPGGGSNGNDNDPN